VAGTGLPNQQWGKNMSVRGSGANTRILMDNRNFLAVFTTEDGETFTPTFLLPEGAADDWNRSLVWGEDGTNFWGKSNGRPLHQWAYQAGSTNAPLIRTYSGNPGEAIEQIGFDETYDHFAGFTVQSGPDQVELYDISDLFRGPMLVDVSPFASDNPQTVGYGNVLISRNRVFVLNPNNGVLALTYAPRLSIRSEGANVIVSWPRTLPDYANYTLKVADTVLLADAETVAHSAGAESYQATVQAGESQRFFFLTKE